MIAFIDIAAGGIGGRSEFLHEPKPRFTNIKKCKLKEKAAEPIPTEKKMDTKEEMQAEILKLRKQYEPFLKNYAPKQELLRRDTRMISNAIHLFIDAWLSGWMKTIMDCDRNPKQAYFAYKMPWRR